MERRTPIRIILTITLTLWGVMSPAYADDWNYSCQGWVPSSLLHRGPVAVVLSDDQLTWSNGRKNYTAKFVTAAGPEKPISTMLLYILSTAFGLEQRPLRLD